MLLCASPGSGHGAADDIVMPRRCEYPPYQLRHGLAWYGVWSLQRFSDSISRITATGGGPSHVFQLIARWRLRSNHAQYKHTDFFMCMCFLAGEHLSLQCLIDGRRLAWSVPLAPSPTVGLSPPRLCVPRSPPLNLVDTLLQPWKALTSSTEIQTTFEPTCNPSQSEGCPLLVPSFS